MFPNLAQFLAAVRVVRPVHYRLALGRNQRFSVMGNHLASRARRVGQGPARPHYTYYPTLDFPDGWFPSFGLVSIHLEA